MNLPSYLIFCIFAATLSIVRILYTGDTYFNGLLWNLILAFLPYIFSLLYIKDIGWLRHMFLFLWFIFLPNSFYIVTDFVHLSRDGNMLYYDIILILSMSMAAMVSGFASMEIVHQSWNMRIRGLWSWFYMTSTIIVAMIGVYIGRFLRFNSWDFWEDPITLMREVGTLLISNGSLWQISSVTRLAESNKYAQGALGLWQFVALYGAFFLIVYIFLYQSKHCKK